MSSDCIFCKIVRGEIPCAKVYETDTILAFLDIAPVAFGHTLVIPKEHHDTFFDVPVSLCRDLHTALQKVGQGMMQSTKAEGMNLGMNVLQAAGQVVFHAHYHLIPRFKDDGHTLWPQKSYDHPDMMQQLAATIRNAIA